MKKINENHFLIIISSIISIIILTILMNLDNVITSNIILLSTLLVGVTISLIIGKIKKRNLFKYISIPTSCFLILLTLFNIFTISDIIFGWSEKAAFNSIYSKIKNKSELIYETNLSKIYYNDKEKIIYSVNKIEDQSSVLQNSIMPAEKSEYRNYYTSGFKANIKSKNIKELYIHEPTTAALSNNEYIFEMTMNNDEIYLCKVFIVGKIPEFNNYKKVLKINYEKDNDFYYDLYKDENNFILNNTYETTKTPFLKVKYRKEDLFSYRYSEYMKKYDPTFTDDTDTSNIIFSVKCNREINKNNIKNIVVYDQIEAGIYKVGSFLEIVYDDGTSEIGFFNTLYGESISSIEIY